MGSSPTRVRVALPALSALRDAPKRQVATQHVATCARRGRPDPPAPFVEVVAHLHLARPPNRTYRYERGLRRRSVLPASASHRNQHSLERVLRVDGTGLDVGVGDRHRLDRCSQPWF